MLHLPSLFLHYLLNTFLLIFGIMPPIQSSNSNDQNLPQKFDYLRENEAKGLFGPGIFQRRILDSLRNRKKNIFREQQRTNEGERTMESERMKQQKNIGNEGTEIWGEELAPEGDERQRPKYKLDQQEEEGRGGRRPKEEGAEEIIRFADEGEEKEKDTAASSSQHSADAGETVLNPFENTNFDQRFPIHNLCGPWNSGRQTSDFEWGEPADKLLRLLNERAPNGKKGRNHYNMFLAPGQITGHSTNVSIAIYIESMSTFKAQTMDFEMDMYFAMAWYDRRLAHNCTHPLLIAHKSIAERIWTPDLYFLNAKFAYLQEVTMPNFMLVIYPDGLVFKSLRIDVTLSCNMDLQLFPFDRQECPMVIQPFAYIENLVNLSWHVDPPFYPITTNPELKLNDMIITGMRFERCTSPYTLFRGTGVWSCLRGYIVMKRLVLFHLIQTYIPSAMLVSVSWMSFWLDPRASPARITLTITSLLTLTTMSNGARQDLPQVSYIKAMDIWQNFSQALIFLVLLEYSFVSYFFSRRSFDCVHRILRGKRTTQQKYGTVAEGEKGTEAAEDGDSGAGEKRRHIQQNGTKPMEMNNNTHGPVRKRCPPNGTGQAKSAISATIPPRTENFFTEIGTPTKGKRPFLCRMNNFREGMLSMMEKTHSEEGILMGLGMMEEGEERMAMPKRNMGEQWGRNNDGEETEGEGGERAGTTEERKRRWRRNSSRTGKSGSRGTHCQQCQWEDEMRGRAVDRCEPDSRVLFPTTFFSFCVAYWLYYGWLMADE